MNPHHLLIFILCLSPHVKASEWLPYDQLDRLGYSNSEEIDHLEPLGPFTNNIPFFRYQALYLEHNSFEQGRFWVLKEPDEGTGQIILEFKLLPVDSLLSGIDEKDLKTLPLDEDNARLIYEIWANTLFETRYPRYATRGFDGSTYIFSTFVTGKGWLSGTAWSPNNEAPPKWLVELGKYIFDYAQSGGESPRDLNQKLTACRDQIRAYLASPPSSKARSSIPADAQID